LAAICSNASSWPKARAAAIRFGSMVCELRLYVSNRKAASVAEGRSRGLNLIYLPGVLNCIYQFAWFALTGPAHHHFIGLSGESLNSRRMTALAGSLGGHLASAAN
jgi:hypothetical protein